ncbi:MAG: matrixin family metalloprotease [Acidobacteria bacterium]|nr:matrixin family metalloprotease [Acidobacteriota bacterium]
MRLLFVWVALAGFAAGQPALHLRTRTLDAQSPRQSGNQSVPPKRHAPGAKHLLIQFENAPTPEDRAELERLGVKLLRYVPDNGFTAAVPEDADLASLRLRHAEPIESRDKISPDLLPVEPDLAATARLAAAEEDGAFLAIFHDDVTATQARVLVQDLGLVIQDHPDLEPSHLLVLGPVAKLLDLAHWDEVEYLLPASPELIQGERVHACSGAVTEHGRVAELAAPVGAGWAPGRGSADLGYFFVNATAKLPEAQQRSEILRGLSEWSKHVKVSYRQAASASATRTIAIRFATGNHGDGSNFDGPAGVLAHAFYPSLPNPEPIAGDLHLDDAETWRIGANFDLFSVALHEVGHSLGLGHSNHTSAVMYPYYRMASELHADDIASIQQLYASTGTAPTSLTITVRTPASSPVTTQGATATLVGTTAGGTNPVRVQWSSDRGGTGAATVSSSTRDWVITSVPLREGSNVFTIAATDSQGARAEKLVTFIRTGSSPTQKTPPVVTITSPSSTSFGTTSSTITITGTAVHSTGIARVSWVNSRGGQGTGVGTQSFRIANLNLQAGVNEITVSVTSGDGMTASRSLSVTLNRGGDTVAPALSILAPVGSVSTTAASVQVRGTAADNIGVTEVTWQLTGGRSGTAAGTTSWSATIPLNVGINTITIRAKDAAGNTGWRSLTVTRRQ